jgi:beta-N-acetylhexosaminidase
MDRFDLVPFRAAIEAGVYAVMLSHVVYTALDPQWPASLSKRVARDLLRGELGFQEVVLTDDVDMGAIANHYDMDTITKQILEAEVDIILLCHTLSKMEAAYDQVLSNIKSASEERGRSIRSVRRILRLKERCIV